MANHGSDQEKTVKGRHWFWECDKCPTRFEQGADESKDAFMARIFDKHSAEHLAADIDLPVEWVRKTAGLATLMRGLPKRQNGKTKKGG